MMESQSKRRRSLRLPNYDYTLAGCYSLTICSQDRECLFSEIRESEALLSDVGRVVQSCWDELPLHFPRIILDAMVLMPNHLHAIVFLRPQQADGSSYSQSALRVAPGSLSAIVRSFKSASTRAARQIGGSPSGSLWQRNYYERVVRSEEELLHLRRYILENPLRWELDEENPDRLRNAQPYRP